MGRKSTDNYDAQARIAEIREETGCGLLRAHKIQEREKIYLDLAMLNNGDFKELRKIVTQLVQKVYG